MCQDCPTVRTRSKAVLEELLSWVVLPFVLIGAVLTSAVVGGAVTLADLLRLLSAG